MEEVDIAERIDVVDGLEEDGFLEEDDDFEDETSLSSGILIPRSDGFLVVLKGFRFFWLLFASVEVFFWFFFFRVCGFCLVMVF